MSPQIRTWTGIAGGAIALADAVIYLVLILRQGESSAIVPWVFSMIVVGAIAAILGSFSDRGLARVLLASAGTIFLILGLVGIFSIGLPLLVAATLCYVGAFQSSAPGEEPPRVGRRVLIGAIAVVLVGTTLFLVQLVGGEESITVSCRSGARGSGMPSLAGNHRQEHAARPHPCRTIISH
jgi:predicted membrane metal-binding protein